MVIGSMRKLNIGYWPLSPTLKSAGDRRRIIFWANARGHSIVTDLNQPVDVIVASENSDFNSLFFSKKKVPVIFDLVDAYLSPLNLFDDFARGFAKHVSRQISGGIKPFSHHVSDFCHNASAVICSSIEQEAQIKRYNHNTHVILDSHDEIPFVNQTGHKTPNTSHHRILWEGQPATIGGIKQVSSTLAEISKTTSLAFDIVTDEKYFQFLNKFLERRTYSLLKKNLGGIVNLSKITPWSPENLARCARASSLAIIPIDLSVPMQRLKPENRLLIMWRLGLPCLTSPSPAYLRVSDEAGVSATCNTPKEWLESSQRILNDPFFASSQISAGQNYLREKHNRSILLKKWDMAFDSVVG
jgi:hypothetical protein